MLHFEKNTTNFVKADCKDVKEKSLFCGSAAHEDDCNGIRCVAGYMRANNYLTNYTKSSKNRGIYKILGELLKADLLQFAIENASFNEKFYPSGFSLCGVRIYEYFQKFFFLAGGFLL